MNKLLNGLKENANLTYTENGAITRKSTNSALMDMFALGGAYRTRTDEDCILLFKNAFEENPLYALKCLFYLRDVRGGQGERRFFRVCIKWAAEEYTDSIKRNLVYISDFGRWDDLYSFIGTKLENDALEIIKQQLLLDINCETPSLLAKWLKSENSSSYETQKLGNVTRKYLGMTHKQYRKTLSILRSKINIIETLMSEGRWNEIEFDKISSRAGIIYKNAFARRDVIKEKYLSFAKDKSTTVNAKALYPYECVAEALKLFRYRRLGADAVSVNDANRLIINKYWDNLEDYFKDSVFNGLAIVDTSGSMCGSTASAPINVAISLGMYCAEKAKGPFNNHFITFSSMPTLIKVEGVDFCDKVYRAHFANWGMDTNIEATFDLILNTAIENNCSQNELPQNLIIISDMEFNACAISGSARQDKWCSSKSSFNETLFETIEKRWNENGYKMPHLVFWNCQARQNNIPMRETKYVSYVSGMSPIIFETIMSGKTGEELMFEKLNSERYICIKK